MVINKLTVKICVFCSLILICACENEEKKTYYSNGSIKVHALLKNSKYEGMYLEYNENGTLNTKLTFLDGSRQGTSFHYYEPDHKFSKSEITWENDKAIYQKNFNQDSVLISEGNLLKYNFKIGKWRFYDNNGKLKEVQELIDINGNPYLNQNWKFNSNGDTIGGNYFELKRTFLDMHKSELRIYFFLRQPIIGFDSELFVCLPKKDNLKNDFANENAIKWDTIYNLSRRFKSNIKYKNANHDVVFDINVKSLKGKSLKGYLLEKSTKKVDSFDHVIRKIYFDIPDILND